MPKITVDSNKGRTVPATIFAMYQEYVDFGYPKDPAVYVLRASPSTLRKLKTYFELNETIPVMVLDLDKHKLLVGKTFFQITEDNRMPLGQFMFGPEQYEIIWTGK